jgi:hypothetical protein
MDEVCMDARPTPEPTLFTFLMGVGSAAGVVCRLLAGRIPGSGELNLSGSLFFLSFSLGVAVGQFLLLSRLRANLPESKILGGTLVLLTGCTYGYLGASIMALLLHWPIWWPDGEWR